MGGLASGLLGTALSVSVLTATMMPSNAAPAYLTKPTEVSAGAENVHYRRRPYHGRYYRDRCYNCGRYYAPRYYRPYYGGYYGRYYGGYHNPYYRYGPYYPPYWYNGGVTLYFSF